MSCTLLFLFYKNKCNNNAGLRHALAFRLTKLVKNSNFLIWLWVLFSLLLPSLWIVLLFRTLFDLPDGDLAVTTRRATEDISILGRAERLNAVWMGLQLLCYHVALYVHYQHLATQLTITLTPSITPSMTANPDLRIQKDTNERFHWINENFWMIKITEWLTCLCKPHKTCWQQ